MASTSCSFCSSSLRNKTSNIYYCRKIKSSVNFESQYSKVQGIPKDYNKLEYECKKYNLRKEFNHLSTTRCELFSTDLQCLDFSNLYLKWAKKKLIQSRQKTERWLVARLFDPIELDPSKLTVNFIDSLNPADVAKPSQLMPRRYTLTHNDLTAAIHLTIGSIWNRKQVEGWYTRLLRDEIIAEWRIHSQYQEKLSLHIFCHVSGSHSFMLPAPFRNWIFKREMPLVLKAIILGDKHFLDSYPELEESTVWVHYQSCQSEFNRADCLGPLILAANGDSKSTSNQSQSQSQSPSFNTSINLIASSKIHREIMNSQTKLTSLRPSIDPVLCLNEIPSTSQLSSQVKKASLTKRDG